MIRARIFAAMAAVVAAIAAAPAHADLNICNRTSYRMQAALGIEHGAAVSTRGGIRLDPGECKKAADVAADADTVYVHARTPPVYGAALLSVFGVGVFCVRVSVFFFGFVC